MNYPTRIDKKGKEYRFVKKYPNFGVYIDESGNRECFTLYDTGIIPRRQNANNKGLDEI